MAAGQCATTSTPLSDFWTQATVCYIEGWPISSERRGPSSMRRGSPAHREEDSVHAGPIVLEALGELVLDGPGNQEREVDAQRGAAGRVQGFRATLDGAGIKELEVELPQEEGRQQPERRCASPVDDQRIAIGGIGDRDAGGADGEVLVSPQRLE